MKVTFLHTVAPLAPQLGQLARELFPDLEVRHMVDENLLADARATGGVGPEGYLRAATYAAFAERSGAEKLLVTCSSLGEAAEAARRSVSIPVLRIDEPMARQAVSAGERIGVIGSLSTTLGPTTRLIERFIVGSPEPHELQTATCAGAFDALDRGERDEHDRIVREELKKLADRVDVIVLAQASMARVAETVELGVPVLSSPRSGIAQLGDDELSTTPQ